MSFRSVLLYVNIVNIFCMILVLIIFTIYVKIIIKILRKVIFVQNIFFGLIIIFLDFEIAYNDSIIGVIPDFYGYLLIYRALNIISDKSAGFTKIKLFCAAAAAYEFIVWTIDIIGLRYDKALIFVKIISFVMLIYISYYITEGIGDIQKNSGVNIYYENLAKYWKYCVTGHVLFALLSFIFTDISLILSVLSVVSGILFLCAFYKTKKIYYDNL